MNNTHAFYVHVGNVVSQAADDEKGASGGAAIADHLPGDFCTGERAGLGFSLSRISKVSRTAL